MKVFLATFTALVIGACSAAKPPTPAKPPSVNLPTTEEKERPTNSTPRTIEIGLTLSSPDDLKVKQGDSVEAGQVLADRTQERQQLEEKLALLTLNMERISTPISKPPAPIELLPFPELPPGDFSSEQLGVKSAELNLTNAAKATAMQQNLIEALISEGISETSDAIAHEQAKLAIAQMKKQQAKLSLELAKASLKSAESARAYAEYRHSLEQQKRILDLQQQQIVWQRSQANYADALREQQSQQLAAAIQIEGIQEKLDTLTAVAAPFDGTIRRIKYEAQNNRVMRVVAILDVAAGGATNNAKNRGNPRSPNIAMFQSVRAVR